MKFKKFIVEEENDITNALSLISKELALYTSEELKDFGEWLEDEIGLDSDEEEFENYNFDTIIEIISNLNSEDLDYIQYMMKDADADDENYDHYASVDDSVDEGVSVKFKAKDRNKKKNKKFTLSKAKFRAGKANRKKDNRKNKAKKKKAYRKNKVKLKKYNKSYNAAVKSGKHNKKVRR